jgi:cyclopropane fatty-acyl-phospholipid synthase-like methyltransferase
LSDERAKYADLYGRPRAAAFGAIWRGVWGDELAYELAPANWITWRELRRIAAELGVGAGSTLLDLGSGGGGPGLWVAAQIGAGILGVDLSPEGCAAARKRAAEKHPSVTAEYHDADMTATGLPSACADAALSIDAVQIVPQRAAAFREAGRLLRPGARFVLCTFDHPDGVTADELMPGREVVPDSRPLLEAAGFRVLAYDRITSWDERAVATYRALLAQREVVAAVAGEGLVREAEWGAAHAERSVHVFIVCERTPSR